MQRSEKYNIGLWHVLESKYKVASNGDTEVKPKNVPHIECLIGSH